MPSCKLSLEPTQPALQVLQANSTVANGMTYNLALQLSMGPSGDKIYNVAVSKDLQNKYKLVSAKQQQ